MKNPTVDLDALFFWTITMNNRALAFLRRKEDENEDELLNDQKKLKKKDLLKYNMGKTYEVQKGAAEGKSICTLKINPSPNYGAIRRI